MKRMIRENLKAIIYGAVGLVISIGIIWGIAMIVNGQSCEESIFWDEYYYNLERQYADQVREYLDEFGLENAGIAITYTAMADESRVYTVKIHHIEMKYLEGDAIAQICDDISDLGFSDERCSFRTVVF